MIPTHTFEAEPTGRLRTAVFGLDRNGLAHAAVLAMRTDCELVALGDPDAAAVRRTRALGFAVRTATRLERLLEEATPQALVLCVPPAARAGAVRAALAAGVATLVQPPLAATLEDAEALAALAASRGVPLAVAHGLPFEPCFVHALREVRAGALGDPRLVRSSVYASRVFSTAEARAMTRVSPGGVMSAEGLDLLLMLDAMFGTPVQVRATTSALYGGHEDEAHAMLTLAGGLEVGLDASWSVPGHATPTTVIEAEGSNGVLLVSDDAFESELTVTRAGLPAGHRLVRDAELPQSARFDLDGEARDPLVAAFVAWAEGGPEPPHGASASLRAQRTLEALYASARRGGTSVRVGP